MDQHKIIDKLLIREILENWVIWRDSGKWERFADLWHPEAVMMATWRQSPFKTFIKDCKLAWEKGPRGQHLLNGSNIEIAGSRAVA